MVIAFDVMLVIAMLGIWIMAFWLAWSRSLLIDDVERLEAAVRLQKSEAEYWRSKAFELAQAALEAEAGSGSDA